MDTIGKRIRALREDMDLSQKELATKAEMTEATLTIYEDIKSCSALEITISGYF